jgi:hypothetical protein
MMTDLKKLRDFDPVDPSLYRQLIGSLMYLENTQPDIFLVGCLSYDIQLHGFIDSDWAGSADDIRSATWICFSLSFSTMLWASRKHKSVALNTVEVEYITFVMLVRIEINHYILYDQFQRGEVALQYISTNEQIEIILVKPLSKMKRLHT